MHDGNKSKAAAKPVGVKAVKGVDREAQAEKRGALRREVSDASIMNNATVLLFAADQESPA